MASFVLEFNEHCTVRLWERFTNHVWIATRYPLELNTDGTLRTIPLKRSMYIEKIEMCAPDGTSLWMHRLEMPWNPAIYGDRVQISHVHGFTYQEGKE